MSFGWRLNSTHSEEEGLFSYLNAEILFWTGLPESAGTLHVAYSIRGEGINCEGNQFDNCYVGFIYKDSEGNRQFNANHYSGSFDWKEDSLQMNIEELRASEIEFCVFLSISGTLWIDDVDFSE